MSVDSYFKVVRTVVPATDVTEYDVSCIGREKREVSACTRQGLDRLEQVFRTPHDPKQYCTLKARSQARKVPE